MKRGGLLERLLVRETRGKPANHAVANAPVSTSLGSVTSVSSSVNAQRTMRGGHDPRKLARLSAQARREKRQQREAEQDYPHPSVSAGNPAAGRGAERETGGPHHGVASSRLGDLTVREKALRQIEVDLEDPDPGVRRKAVQLLSYFESKQATGPEFKEPVVVGDRSGGLFSLGEIAAFAQSLLERPLERVSDVQGVPRPTEFSEPVSPARVKFDGRWMTPDLAARERAAHEKWRRQAEYANANERPNYEASP
jgi:hypothetical protein